MISHRFLGICSVLIGLTGCGTNHRSTPPGPPIINIPALIGKPYDVAKASLSAYEMSEKVGISPNDDDAQLRGGISYTYHIGTVNLDVDTSPNGQVWRVEASDIESLGYSLDDAADALERFGIHAAAPADVVADAARRWNNIDGNKVAATSSEPGGKVWQVQVAKVDE